MFTSFLLWASKVSWYSSSLLFYYWWVFTVDPPPSCISGLQLVFPPTSMLFVSQTSLGTSSIVQPQLSSTSVILTSWDQAKRLDNQEFRLRLLISVHACKDRDECAVIPGFSLYTLGPLSLWSRPTSVVWFCFAVSVALVYWMDWEAFQRYFELPKFLSLSIDKITAANSCS